MGENLLHQYVNYTYLLELWACSKDTFNSNGTEGDELLMADGGLGEKKGEIFNVNFSIDNVEIETLIGGLGKNGFAANALSIKFEIIEPYTVTLLEKLARVATKYADDDIKTIIYMLKIKFIGYNDGGYGEPQLIDGLEKRFFFNMINIGFKVTHRGALYTCEGIATKNLSMIPVLDNEIKGHVELHGKTVNELFGVGSDDKEAKNLKNAIVNQQQKNIKDKIQTIPNQVTFEFEDELGNAKIIDPNDIDIPNSTIPGSNLGKSQAAQTLKQGREGKLEINSQQGVVKAHAGTRIVDFIGSILSSTDYMKNQVGQKDGPFIGWKVFPELKIGEYDTALNFFSRTLVYKVKKYSYSGLDHPAFGQKPPDNIVKTYNYVYTGMNKDAIKVNLDFHMAYFEVRSNKLHFGKNETETPEQDDDTVDETKNPANFHRPGISPVTTNATQSNTSSKNNDEKTIAVNEMISKLLDNGVDMMSLDIDIVGDPDWILQEEEQDIKYISQDVNFKFNFITPTNDYMENGLFDVSSSTSAYFGGIYKVIAVTNHFRKGRFSQTLKNVRVRVQPE